MALMPKSKSWRAIIFLAGFALLIALCYAEENWRGKRDWDRCKRELEAKGEAINWKDYIPAPVPDNQNFFAVPNMAAWFIKSQTGQHTSNAFSARLSLDEFLRQSPRSNSVTMMELTVLPPGSPAAVTNNPDIVLRYSSFGGAFFIQDALGDTNNIDIPIIHFIDVSITTAIENLARVANLNYLLDPAIGYGQADGYPPLDVTGITPDEVSKTVCETCPKPPSDRVNEKNNNKYFQVVHKRGLDPAQLEKTIRGHLDMITMRCLQKDPNLRYPNVRSLIEDVHSFLRPKSENTSILPKTKITVCTIVIILIVMCGYLVAPTIGKLLKSGSVKEPSSPINGSTSTPKASPPAPPQLTQEQIDFQADHDIYNKIQSGIKAPTFEGAQVILDQIDSDEINDEYLASYYCIADEIAEFCPKVGIHRNAEPSWSKLLKNTDIIALAKQSLESPLETLSMAYKIKNELDMFDSLGKTLEQRYGE